MAEAKIYEDDRLILWREERDVGQGRIAITERTEYKPGSPESNQASLRARAEVMRAELRATIETHRTARDAIMVTRNAIPAANQMTNAITRQGLIDVLLYERDIRVALIDTEQRILNVVRLLLEDYSAPAE